VKKPDKKLINLPANENYGRAIMTLLGRPNFPVRDGMACINPHPRELGILNF
jgi:hypothetical protein